MKCIKCETNNSFKDIDRNQGQCRKCDHQVVFDPAEVEFRSELSDHLFEKLITEVSVDGTLHFTPIQLYYHLEKRLRSGLVGDNPAVTYLCCGGLFLCTGIWIAKWLNFDLLVIPILVILYTAFVVIVIARFAIKPQISRKIRQENIQTLKILIVVIPVFGIPLSIVTKAFVGIVGSIGLCLIATWFYYDSRRKQSQIFDCFLVDRKDFHLWLNRWVSINDFPQKILASPKISTAQVAASPRAIAYKFDRVVVCNSSNIAQLLIKNNFHFSNNCAVLGIDRYPHRDFMKIKEMLDSIPDLQVFAFHDCSPQGLRMIRHLRTEKIWFPNLTTPIIDIGIRPYQIMDDPDKIVSQSAESMRLSQQLAADLRNILDPAELDWLDAGFYLELESLPPQELIEILEQAIYKSYRLAEIEDGDSVVMNSPGLYTVEGL